MLQIIGIIVGVIVIVIAVILAIAATKPNEFRVQRSGSMKASREKVFPFINDFHHWGSWSPWEKLDPAMTKTHSGAPSGKGAIYEWKGNKKVGRGRMEITESSAPAKIVIKLDFFEPFAANNIAEFALDSQGDTTTVNWSMLGKSPFMFKVMGLFMNMDNMIGKDFETGLANLKGLAEK